jgi:hypothetical protein
MGVSGQSHTPAVLYPRDGTHRIGGRADPRVVWTQRLEEKSFAPAVDQTPVH